MVRPKLSRTIRGETELLCSECKSVFIAREPDVRQFHGYRAFEFTTGIGVFSAGCTVCGAAVRFEAEGLLSVAVWKCVRCAHCAHYTPMQATNAELVSLLEKTGEWNGYCMNCGQSISADLRRGPFREQFAELARSVA